MSNWKSNNDIWNKMNSIGELLMNTLHKQAYISLVNLEMIIKNVIKNEEKYYNKLLLKRSLSITLLSLFFIKK